MKSYVFALSIYDKYSMPLVSRFIMKSATDMVYDFQLYVYSAKTILGKVMQKATKVFLTLCMEKGIINGHFNGKH